MRICVYAMVLLGSIFHYFHGHHHEPEKLAALALVSLATLPAWAQEKVLNLYSARHNQTDEALYTNFTKQTGIKINRIEAGENELLERLRNEGVHSPADIFLTVDAARLGKAEELELFAPVKSRLLTRRIPPATLQTRGFHFRSARASSWPIRPAWIRPTCRPTKIWPNRTSRARCVCVRAPIRITCRLARRCWRIMATKKTEAWAKTLVANFARAPKGGDTDQIKAVAAGECGFALISSYYVACMLRSEKPEDRKMMESVTVIWPNQKTTGAHINISGGGMLKTAPNKHAAVKFLEYLASDQAQVYFADGNSEWPVLAGAKTSNPALQARGDFMADTVKVGALAAKQADVQKIYDRADWR